MILYYKKISRKIYEIYKSNSYKISKNIDSSETKNWNNQKIVKYLRLFYDNISRKYFLIRL